MNFSSCLFPLHWSLWMNCNLSLSPLFAPTLIWVPSANLAAVEFTPKQFVTQMRLMAGFSAPVAAQQGQPRSFWKLGADTCAIETTQATPASAVPASSCDQAGPRGCTRCSLKYQQRGERHGMRLGYRVMLGHILHKLHMRALPPDFYSQPAQATCPSALTEKKYLGKEAENVIFVRLDCRNKL